MEFFKKLFENDFMPHGHCYFWDPAIVWTNAISDSLIALAYLTIPLTLIFIVRARKDINFIPLIVLFAAFILSCSLTHIMDVINIWHPFYRLDSTFRVITAIASIGTAFMLVKIAPQILSIPTTDVHKKLTDELRQQNQELAAALEELKSAEENLIKLNDELEQKVTERTEELSASEEELKQLLEESTALNAVIAESEIRLSKERQVLYNSFMNAPAGIAILQGGALTFEFANANYEKLVGRKITLGHTVQAHFPEIEQQGYIQLLNNVFASGESFINNEIAIDLNTKGNGNVEQYFLNLFLQPLKDEMGKVDRIMAHVIDVTAQVKARKQIEASEAAARQQATYLKLATDSANVGTWSLDLQTQKLEWSGLHKKMWGYDEHRTDLNYEDWHKIILPEDKEMAFKKVEEARLHDTVYESNYFIKKEQNGELRYMRSYGKYNYNVKGEAESLTGITIDITDQKEAEFKLKTSEEKYRGLFETMDQGLSIVELIFDENNKPLDYRFIENNPVFCQQTGLPDLTNKTAREAIPTLEDFWFETFGKVALTGEPIRFTQESTPLNRWFEVYAFRLGEKGSKMVAILFTNITERIHSDEKLKFSLQETFKINEELSRKNDFLDNFVFMAAHDLRAPITNMKQLISLIDVEEDKLQKIKYEKILEASVDRLDYTVNGMVEIIEVQSNDNIAFKDLALNDILQMVLDEQEETIKSIGATVKIKLHYDRIVYIEAYILSIIKNLITNAIKYKSDHKSLIIDIETRKEDSFIILTIADNGMGMDMERVGKQLFKPFTRFTKKAHGKGIGLHLIKSMVEKNGGKIEVNSAINEGSTFKIYLKEYEFNG